MESCLGQCLLLEDFNLVLHKGAFTYYVSTFLEVFDPPPPQGADVICESLLKIFAISGNSTVCNESPCMLEWLHVHDYL